MTERTLREKIAALITEDHLQLLSDFDVDGDIYRQDPECVGSAYMMADAILALLDAQTEQPAPSAASTDNTALVEAAGAVLRLWENGCKDRSWRQHFYDALGRLALALASREAMRAPNQIEKQHPETDLMTQALIRGAESYRVAVPLMEAWGNLPRSAQVAICMEFADLRALAQGSRP